MGGRGEERDERAKMEPHTTSDATNLQLKVRETFSKLKRFGQIFLQLFTFQNSYLLVTFGLIAWPVAEGRASSRWNSGSSLSHVAVWPLNKGNSDE